MRAPELVAFDLDGTLAESKQRMSSDMGDLLSRLLRRMPVAVMSGAGWPQFEKQFFPALPEGTPLNNLYIFPDNAAQCFVHRAGEWLPQYDQAFSPAEKERITKALKDALQAVGLERAPVRVWGERIEDRGEEIAFSPLGQEAPLEEKGEWHKGHDDVRRRLQEELRKRLPEYASAMGGLTTIDITRKGINKAYGIKRLSELAHTPITQILYVGDALEAGGNDAVVLDVGVPTHAVFGPEETSELIENLLARKPAVSLGA